jgi:hypothetical protein
LSTARQNVVDGQDTLARFSVSDPVAGFSAPQLPPVGFPLTTTSPAPPTATHSAVDGQDTDASACVDPVPTADQLPPVPGVLSIEALSEPTATQRPNAGHETLVGAVTADDTGAVHDSGAAALAAPAASASSASMNASTRAPRI